jgi:methionine biosynthesis protein MetW
VDLTKFYSDSSRLDYHPGAGISKGRKGLKKLLSFDDRFVQVDTKLTEILRSKIVGNSKKLKVLDVGVGDGVYERLLTGNVRKKVDLYGVDISKKQLKRARKHVDYIKCVNVDSEKIPFEDSKFDLVIVSELLEHLFTPEKVLFEAVRLLKKGGLLFLTYPNSGSLQIRISLLFTGRSPMLNYSKNKEHIRFFDKKDIFEIIGDRLKMVYFQGTGSFVFDKWNFPMRIPTLRFMQVVINRFFPQYALGHFLIFQK